jgi:hypothetical protein
MRVFECSKCRVLYGASIKLCPVCKEKEPMFYEVNFKEEEGNDDY